MSKPEFPATGGCACGEVRYQVMSAPMTVHCCHCHWCQRETGAAFAINAMYESDRVKVIAGATKEVAIPSHSGKGQKIVRCPGCRIALWSHYAGAGDAVKFLRVGTLDNPDICPPSVHIFTASKQMWLQLPADVPSFDHYYDRKALWPAESLARYKALKD